MQLFGGIMQNAIAEGVRSEWRRQPYAAIACLENSGVSVRDLMLRGITPDDPGVRAKLFQCQRDNARSEPVAPTVSNSGADTRKFVVDGLELAGIVRTESAMYRAYDCNPSEQFNSFTFCQQSRVENGRAESIKSTNSILHGQDHIAAYVSRSIAPAYFGQGDIDREIKRLSGRFGSQARVLRSPAAPDGTSGIIAYWGELTLEKIDAANLTQLAEGRSVRLGFLLDFLGGFTKSARLGMPVYKIGGGAGYIYAATFDQEGKGRLRIAAADASRYAPNSQPPMSYASVETAQQILPSQPVQIDPAIAEGVRRTRVEKLAPTAKQLITDASEVLKVDQANPKLLEYVEQISGLNAAMVQGDADAIEKRSMALSTALQREPKYAEIVKARVAEIKRQEAIHLGEAIKLTKRQKRFVLSYIAQNPASPNAATFLPLIRLLDPSLEKPSLPTLQALNEKIDMAIRQSNLQNDFSAEPSEATDKSVIAAAPNFDGPLRGGGMPRTEKNKFLIDGDLDDLMLLYNGSPQSRHVARNLRGEIVFQDGQADVCIFQKDADDLLRLAIRDAVRAFKPKVRRHRSG